MFVRRAIDHYLKGKRSRRDVTRFLETHPDLDRLAVTVVHDRSVTEIFVADGHTAFSLRSYLDPDGFQVTLDGEVSVALAAATVLP